MSKNRTWDLEELTERRKVKRFRAAVSTVAQAIVLIGVAAALPAIDVPVISAATPDYFVISVRSQALPVPARLKRSAKGEFDPDVQEGISTIRLGQTMPAFFRETSPDEIVDLELPPL